ncbi:MAG: DNA-binding response regulator, partial [Pseudomonas amygdali]
MTNLSQTFQLPFMSQLKGRESFLSFTGGGLPVNSTATSLDAQIDNNSDNQETAMRVLLVEDHLQLAESVAQAL